MKDFADFTVIPDDFAKAAALNTSMACLWSPFPFYIDDVILRPATLHWEFVDPDSIRLRLRVDSARP